MKYKILGLFVLFVIGFTALLVNEAFDEDKYECDDKQLTKVIDEYMTCKKSNNQIYSKACFDNAMESNCKKHE